MRDIVSRTVGFSGMGLALGTSAVAALGTLGSDVLHGTSARDPLVLGPVAAFLFLVSLGAALWPAWNATRTSRTTPVSRELAADR